LHYLCGIARIRSFYRTLGEEASQHFTPAQGRWPEVESPALRLGALSAFLGTTASMIAVINSVVAGAAVALLLEMFAPPSPRWLGVAVGVISALALTGAFLIYQRWRFNACRFVVLLEIDLARLWRIDSKADYGAFNRLATDRVNLKLIGEQSDDLPTVRRFPDARRRASFRSSAVAANQHRELTARRFAGWRT
jgi:hypothetical protein